MRIWISGLIISRLYWLKNNWLRVTVHLGAWLPLVWMGVDAFQGNLTANPIQAAILRTGKPALVLLISSLACTPLSSIFKLRQALLVRRTLGLYAFFYASLHFLIFLGLDYGFNLPLLQEAIFEKRFALVGFSAWIILLPLAMTSTKGWMKRLGKNWKHLHRLVYLAGILAVVHFVWLVKSDIREPLSWGAVLLLLLIARISWVRRRVMALRNWINSRGSYLFQKKSEAL